MSAKNSLLYFLLLPTYAWRRRRRRKKQRKKHATTLIEHTEFLFESYLTPEMNCWLPRTHNSVRHNRCKCYSIHSFHCCCSAFVVVCVGVEMVDVQTLQQASSLILPMRDFDVLPAGVFDVLAHAMIPTKYTSTTWLNFTTCSSLGSTTC